MSHIAHSAKVASLGDLGRYGEALSLADQVVVFPREHHFYGQLESLLTSRADVLVKAGKTGEALTSYQDALKYAKLIRSWRAITMIDAKIAAQYERQGALTDALNAINEAIDANKQNPQEIFLVPRSIAIKARVLAKLGQHASAEGLYRKGADVLDALLARVPTPEIERLVLTELGDLYSGYFELLSNEGRYADAFHVVEQARGRIEAQELEYDHTEAPHSLTPQDELLRKLETELVDTDDQVQRTRILRQVKAAQDNAPMERTDEKTTTLAELQKQLNPDELYVEYVLADPQSYALAITRSQVKRYALPTKTALEEESTKYRDTLRKQRTDSKLGQQLFRELLEFTHEFADTRSIIIVADGALHLLPFGALIDESGKYVIEKQPVTMSPSGTVLVLLRSQVEKPTTTRPYLGVAAWTEAADKRPWVLQKISTDHKRGDLSALPASRDEVESIGAIMPQPSTMLFGRQATKAEFQSLPLGDYRILHLALHGVVDPVFPDKSALVFAPSGQDNGHLEARDIRRMHLNADLVTLSACDTAIGPVGAAGVESVDTAFIEAGAGAVVSTLWELEDRATSRLMKAFYTHLSRENKADALRDAELDLMHAGMAPYYWASYELVGNPGRERIATK